MTNDVSTRVKRILILAVLTLLVAGVGDAAQTAFPVPVDYAQSLDAMVRAGRYDYVDSDITEKHFPVMSGPQNVSIELVHFDRVMSSDDVFSELDRKGFRPATLPEILSFGAKYPEKQREFPVVALGSVRRDGSGSREVPYLWSGAVGRGLSLDWLVGRWGSYYRFAAVRKG